MTAPIPIDFESLLAQLKSDSTKVFNKAMKTRLTENFTIKEFLVYRTRKQINAHLTVEILRNIYALALRMQNLRQRLDKRIVITSGWRDPITNKRVGGVTASRHLTGEACDFIVIGSTPKRVQDWLDLFWEGGLGYGATFTHLDIRPYRARFGYG